MKLVRNRSIVERHDWTHFIVSPDHILKYTSPVHLSTHYIKMSRRPHPTMVLNFILGFNYMVYYNVFLRRRQRNRKRSLWVHPILTLHRQQGEYNNFLWEMHLSNTKYHFRYLRMSKVQLSTGRCRHVWFWQSDWLDTT